MTAGKVRHPAPDGESGLAGVPARLNDISERAWRVSHLGGNQLVSHSNRIYHGSAAQPSKKSRSEENATAMKLFDWWRGKESNNTCHTVLN